MHSTDKMDDGYFGSGKIITASLKKHGVHSHTKEIVEILPTRSDLKTREREMITLEMRQDPLCMNIRPGGEGFSGEELREWWSDPEYRTRTSTAISSSMKRRESSKGVNNRNLTRWVLKNPSGEIIDQPSDQTGRQFIESLGLSYQMLIKFRSKNLPLSGMWLGWEVVSTTRPSGQKQTKSGARRSTRSA
jgi:hypothetical protein